MIRRPPRSTLFPHDALPISTAVGRKRWLFIGHPDAGWRSAVIYSALISCRRRGDRKSTRLNSSHVEISYAVFCLKKKKRREDKTAHITHIDAHHDPCTRKDI